MSPEDFLEAIRVMDSGQITELRSLLEPEPSLVQVPTEAEVRRFGRSLGDRTPKAKAVPSGITLTADMMVDGPAEDLLRMVKRAERRINGT